MEERDTPTVTLVNRGFTPDAESACRGKAMPPLRFLPTTVPCEGTIIGDIAEGVDLILEAIIAALTTPLSEEEKSPQPETPNPLDRIILNSSLQEINRTFYRRGWTDGLPIIPPTETAVAEMLTGTDLAADHVLGKLESRPGKATVEKIAVNAVMAGALPTHMPVLIAATKLLLVSEPGFCGFTTFGFSTGSWAPFWIINGPIRNDIRVNHGSGALSPGDIANAAIGRAMGLIIKNIGGVRKGVEDMGVMGNPMKYTMVIAENEEESPWQALHEEYGYQKQENTITVSYPQTYLQHWPYSSDAEGILNAVVANIPRAMRYTITFTPPHARNLQREGYTKEDVKNFIVRHTRFSSLPSANAGLPGGTSTSISDPRFIRIIVAGGPGAFIAHAAGGGATPGKKQTERIELPQSWPQLVAKYQDMVPTYAQY